MQEIKKRKGNFTKTHVQIPIRGSTRFQRGLDHRVDRALQGGILFLLAPVLMHVLLLQKLSRLHEDKVERRRVADSNSVVDG